MRVYTAETDDGRIYLISGAIDVAESGRQTFADAALALLRTFPEDESTARTLELYEWADEQAAGVWLAGTPSGGGSWTEMAKAASFGKITYEFPGEYVLRLFGEVGS